MSISFNNIPSALRVPLTYIEFDNTKAVSGPHRLAQSVDVRHKTCHRLS